MAEEGKSNPVDSGLKSLKALGKAAGGAAEGVGQVLGAASPVPVDPNTAKAVGLCACLGCFGLIVMILIFISFAMGLGKKARLSAEPPPAVAAGAQGAWQAGLGAFGGGGSAQGNGGQLDPNSSNADCQTLLATAPGTNDRYIDLINREAKRWNLSPAFVAAIMQQESDFNQTALSGAGARGLMQIMPGTFDGLRQRYPNPPPDQVPNPDDPFDARTSAYYGAAYLNDVRNTLGTNDIRLIAAGYNAGPGAVQQYGGIPPYGETQNYAQVVSRYYDGYQQCLTATK